MSNTSIRSIVVKIGTSSLTNADGVIDRVVIARVAQEVAELRREGLRVTVVTSGAIAAGLPALNLAAGERPSEAVALQAISSIGQPALLETWRSEFDSHGIVVGQILLAPHNFGDRSQYLHARSTLSQLYEYDVVPLINENDAVTDAEIRYGDNDHIAALVANMVEADTLVLLTDTDGVLTADPNIDPEASLIEEIREFDELAGASIGGAGTARGSGGMASKLTAAKIAAHSGVRTVIANAHRTGVISDAVAGSEHVGTVVAPRDSTMSARKLWIGFAMPAIARIVVDNGARDALSKGGRSLLAVGIADIEGDFERRDPVEIADPAGDVFAKGLTRTARVDVDSGDVKLVVHADDLVILDT